MNSDDEYSADSDTNDDDGHARQETKAKDGSIYVTTVSDLRKVLRRLQGNELLRVEKDKTIVAGRHRIRVKEPPKEKKQVNDFTTEELRTLSHTEGCIYMFELLERKNGIAAFLEQYKQGDNVSTALTRFTTDFVDKLIPKDLSEEANEVIAQYCDENDVALHAKIQAIKNAGKWGEFVNAGDGRTLFEEHLKHGSWLGFSMDVEALINKFQL